MVKFSETNFNMSTSALIKRYYKPHYQGLFNKIKGIKAPIKNDLLMALLDGEWHSETELIRIAKKQIYIGAVTLGTMMSSLNQSIKSNYLQKEFINGELHYKISDNFVGLSRAAFSKYRFRLE